MTETTSPGGRPPRNVTAVGGVVVGPAGVLLVRMTYGPTNGLFMLPGGIVDPGETLDDAIVREVLEETGVTASVRGICGVRTRYDDKDNDTYVMFLLDASAGDPRPDGRENDEVRYFSLPELEATEVTELSRYMGRRALRGELKVIEPAGDFDWARSGRDPKSWRLFS